MMHLTEDQIYHLVEAIGNHETLTAEEEQQMEHMVSWQQIQTRKTEQNQKFLRRNQEIFLGYICRSIVRQ